MLLISVVIVDFNSNFDLVGVSFGIIDCIMFIALITNSQTTTCVIYFVVPVSTISQATM